MTERERLVELLCNIPPMNINIGGRRIGKHRYTMSHIADHLLANGVIVPPCKVGDTLYDLTTVDAEKELNVNEIFCGTAQGFSFDGKTIWISASYTNGLFYYHRSNEIGETVFLSRELAEKALAERSKE
jgi:hypothetical protein